VPAWTSQFAGCRRTMRLLITWAQVPARSDYSKGSCPHTALQTNVQACHALCFQKIYDMFGPRAWTPITCMWPTSPCAHACAGLEPSNQAWTVVYALHLSITVVPCPRPIAG
jgi:hypothetical protein